MAPQEAKRRPRLGLVLSGGGAKGAYQEGAFQALAEMQLVPLVEAVSGCSVGALNALLFASGGPELWREVWEQVSVRSFLPAGAGEGFGKRLRAAMDSAARARCLEELLADGGRWPLTQDSLRELVGRVADPAKLAAGSPRISVCAYELEAEGPRYFWLEGRPFSEAVELAMASSAMPGVFPPVEVAGRHYCDGGMPPSYCKNSGDKTPLLPLAGLGLDLIVVVYLNHYDQADRAALPPGTRVLELYPSRPLESAPGAGTMELDPGVLRRHMELGRLDTLAAFAPLLAGALQGLPPEEVLARHQQENLLLLEREQAANQAVRAAALRVRERRGLPSGGAGT